MSDLTAINAQSAIASLIYEARIAANEALDRLDRYADADAINYLATAVSRLNASIHILEKCGRAA